MCPSGRQFAATLLFVLLYYFIFVVMIWKSIPASFSFTTVRLTWVVESLLHQISGSKRFEFIAIKHRVTVAQSTPCLPSLSADQFVVCIYKQLTVRLQYYGDSFIKWESRVEFHIGITVAQLDPRTGHLRNSIIILKFILFELKFLEKLWNFSSMELWKE